MYKFSFRFSLFVSPVSSARSDLGWASKVDACKMSSDKNIFKVNDYGTTNDSTKVISSVIQKAMDPLGKMVRRC